MADDYSDVVCCELRHESRPWDPRFPDFVLRYCDRQRMRGFVDDKPVAYVGCDCCRAVRDYRKTRKWKQAELFGDDG